MADSISATCPKFAHYHLSPGHSYPMQGPDQLGIMQQASPHCQGTDFSHPSQSCFHIASYLLCDDQ